MITDPANKHASINTDVIEQVHRDIAEFLGEQIAAGADREALEDIGYVQVPSEERAEAASVSGQALLGHEVATPHPPKAIKYKKRPPAHTHRAKAARDTPPPGQAKPFPYGPRED